MEVRFYVPPGDVEEDAVEVNVIRCRTNDDRLCFLGFSSKCNERCRRVNRESWRCDLQSIGYQLPRTPVG